MQENISLPSTKTDKLRLQFSSPDESGRVIYTAVLPVIEGHEKINTFYQKIAKKCEEYCKEKLLTQCTKQKSSEPSWEYSYKITFKPVVSDELAEISVSASLYDRGTRRTVSTHTESHLWSLEKNAMLLKPKKNKRTKNAKNLP